MEAKDGQQLPLFRRKCGDVFSSERPDRANSDGWLKESPRGVVPPCRLPPTLRRPLWM